MPTYKHLTAEKATLQAKLQKARATEASNVIEKIRSLMTDYELSIEDIEPKKRRGRSAKAPVNGHAAKTSLPPKYLDPKTGKTWSGRGRAPAWLGRHPKRFLIAEEV
jgi:DNA-binding protein H-NS